MPTNCGTRAKVDALTARVAVVDSDDMIAEHWADLYAELRSAGGLIPANELSVAATARSLSFGVLVGAQDEHHFRQIRELDVQTLTP